MYPEKKGGSHKMARPQQNWGLLTLLTRWASIWTMPNTASPKSEPPCGRAVYTPVRATILGHPPQKTAPGGLKIQGQCHTWRPHSRYNTLSTHITFIRCRWALTFLSIAIEKFDLANPGLRSWLRWTLKVTPWVQHSIDSHPFRSQAISHPIPAIQHFQTLTLKIQGQGHGWAKRWKSQHGSNIISTHIPFVPCQSAIPFLRYNFF